MITNVNQIKYVHVKGAMFDYCECQQSFQVEGPSNREISLFLRNKIRRFFTGTFQGAS